MLLRLLNKLAACAGRVGVSRVTVRIVSAGRLPPGCEELLTDRGFRVEASIALSGPRKLFISYIGKCTARRCADVTDIRQEKLVLDGILAQAKKSPAAIAAEFDRLNDFGVEVATQDNLSTVDCAHLVCLHRKTFPTFPYDFRKKLGMMLRIPEKYPMIIVRSLLNRQICAFSNLELNTVKLDDGTLLSLAEYDNTMRVTSGPQHGVVHGLGGILRLQLALLAVHNEVDLCHAESRAGLAAINRNSHQLGMQFGGTLEKHLLISGQNDINYQTPTRFETMNVWYLNREHLLELAAELDAGMKSAIPG